jgi:hypothetical protein
MIRLLLIVALATSQQNRDTTRPQVGTASLSGVVMTDGPNSEPVRRALVTLVVNGDTGRQRQTSTDDRGRFSFAALPAGNAQVIASKPSYVTTYYGARSPGSTQGVPVALTNGQASAINVRLARGGVIAGTVSDESGRPMPGVGVRVQLITTSSSGQRSFRSATAGALVPTTDDRGAFRIYGLPAGTFVVSAQPRLLVPGEVGRTTAAEVQWAERTIAGTPGSAAVPTDSAPPRGPSAAYANVYFPSAVTLADAGVITLAAGQERGGINLRMQFVTTARLQGTVTLPDGRPAAGVPVSVLLKDEANPDAERARALFEAGLTAARPAPSATDGTFSLSGIEPGDYYVLARTGGPGLPGARIADRMWAMTELRVDGTNIDGVALRLAPAVSLAGRVVFAGSGTPPAGRGLSAAVRPVDVRGISGQLPTRPLSTDLAFQIDGIVPAVYIFAATIPGWTMTSAILNGRDVADTPFDIPAGATTSGLIVTFTDRPAEVSGVLYDAAGRPTSDLSIVLFAADPAMWFNGSRRTRPIVRPASDGRFTFSGLVSGGYLLAALTDVSPNDLNDPAFLREVAAAAIKITVADGERKTQDLRIK